jgi:tRNA threonylcarbamoyladenosine biosynthesis protein TsaE
MHVDETYTITKDGLAAFAAEVLKIVKTENNAAAVVLALSGDLGAGKTTFVQALGDFLGVTETITSPTFTIMKQYDINDGVFSSLIHMDAYRIEDSEELRPLRFSEILATPQTLFCIEWAEKIAAVLPENRYVLTFTVVDEDTRTVHLTRT